MVSFRIELCVYNDNNNTKSEKIWKEKVIDLEDDKYKNKYKVYLDDTLRDLKNKIVHYLLNEKNIKISIDELYIFYTSEDVYNVANAETQLIEKNIYDGSIMDNERIKILNANICDNTKRFSLINNAIKSWDEPDKKTTFYKPLTIDPNDKNNNYDYTFAVNPFNINKLDKIEGVELFTSGKNTTAKNAERLIDCNFIVDNETIILRVVLLEDALKYVETNDAIDNMEFIKLYYPYFKRHNIFTMEKLKDQRNALLQETPKDDDFIWKYYSLINKLNDMKDKNTVNLTVKNIALIIKNKYTMKFPMESIFNNIHANPEIEIIKYNPGYKREPIYRIYAKCLNDKGEKIPYVGKRDVINSTRSSISNDEIGMVIKSSNNDIYENVLLVFNNEGQVIIKCDYNVELDTDTNNIKLDNLDDSIMNLLKTIMDDTKPKIDKVNDFLELTGYEIIGFDDNNVDIFMLKTMDLVYSIKVSQKIKHSDFKKHIIPFESIFSFETYDINKDGAVARFKRVNNYMEPSMDEEIIELLDKKEEEQVIKDYIKIKYKLNDINAIQEIERVKADEIYNNVKKKQGFKMNIKQTKVDKDYILVFNVQNVTSFDYVKILETYIKSLSQHLSKTNKELEKLGNEIKGYVSNIEKQDDIIKDNDFDESSDVNIDLKDTELGDFFEKPVVDERIEQNNNEKQDSFDLSDIDIDEDEDEDIDIDEDEDEDEDEDIDIDEDEDEDIDIDIDIDEDEDEDEVSGGNNVDIKTHSDVKKYFDTLKYKMDKDVFKDVAYSRTCLNNRDKQPLPINKNEYDKIKDTKIKYKKDKNGKGINENIKYLKYENNTDKEDIHYICPRYWDMSNNEMISQEDFNKKYKTEEEKKKILIPKNKKETIPNGAHIYQFYDKVVHKSEDDNKYINMQPYWTSEEVLNVDGTSYGPFPCCGIKDKKESKKENINKFDVFYIIDYESTKRLKPKQLGFLPPSLEKLFGINKKNIVKKENRHELKSKVKTILRMGGNKSKNQSFISCMENIYNEPRDKKIHLKKNVKADIIRYLTINNYAFFNRGTLFSSFLPVNYEEIYEKVVKKDKDIYKESSIYKEFIDNGLGEKKTHSHSDMTTFFKMLIASFEMFKEYISKDDTIIDHTLMLDIMLYIINNRAKIDTKKIDNVIIFEVDDNDELSILCPKNIKLNYKKDGNTIMLLKRGNLYENICDNNKNFSGFENNKHITDKINEIVEEIINFKEDSKYKNNNSGLISPISIQDIKEKIKGQYKIHYQIINNQFLTLGVVLEKNNSIDTDSEHYVYVPCAIEPPEVINNDMKLEHIDVYQHWVKDFKTTIDRYNELKVLGIKLSQALEYDNKIYGFMTNTLQFVAIEPITIKEIIETPNLLENDYNKWITKKVNINHYYSADSVSTIAQVYNEDKHERIQNIRLETTYYNVFRSILRHIIANEGKTNKRKEIQNIRDYINKLVEPDKYKDVTDNKDKLKQKMKELIKELMNDRIIFMDKDYKKPRRYIEITSCMRKNISSNYCDNKKLIIPYYNLNNDAINNSEFYYDKIVDELVRFPQVRKYMLEPNQYLNIGSDSLKVNNDEIIMLETFMLDTLSNTLKIKDKECGGLIIPYKNAIPQK